MEVVRLAARGASRVLIMAASWVSRDRLREAETSFDLKSAWGNYSGGMLGFSLGDPLDRAL